MQHDNCRCIWSADTDYGNGDTADLARVADTLRALYPNATMITVCREVEGESVTLSFWEGGWHGEQSPREPGSFKACAIRRGKCIAEFAGRTVNDLLESIREAYECKPSS